MPLPIIGNPTDDFDISKKLMEKQNAEIIEKLKKHKEKISRVALEVEAILIREDFKWNDWNEICEKFNDRNAYIMPRMKIKEIKQKHDEFTKH